MTEETPTPRWAFARALIGAANVLCGGFFTIVVGALFLESFDAVLVAAIHGLLFLSLLAQVVAGFGLTIGHAWAGRLILGAALGQVVALAAAIFMVKSAWLLIPALPTLASVGLLTMPQFDVKMGRDGEEIGLRPVHLALMVFGLGLIYLVSAEAENVGKELRIYQHESKCEDENSLYDCRQAAHLAMMIAEDVEEMKQLEQRFAPLCEQGNAAACRSIGYVRSDYFSHLGPPRSVLMDRVRNMSTQACLDGDGRGCAVSIWFNPGDREVVVPKAKELCEAGDRDACLVWVHLAGQYRDDESPPPAEGQDAACKAGVTHFCQRATDAEMRCRAGNLEACEEAAAHADSPYLAALAAASRPFGNPGLYGLAVPAGEHTAACETGDDLACMFAGLELLGPVPKPPAEIAPLPPAAELDATIGRACDDGLALACIAYGFRLLDRGIAEERDFERANAWLNKGCAAGSEQACRLVSFEPQLRKYDYDGHRKQLARACAATAGATDCRAYTSLLAYDIGATPWPISDDIAYVHLRDACVKTENPMACANAAYFLDGLEITPEYQLTAIDLGRVACKQGYAEGCQTIFWSTERWWPEHEAAIREKICPQVPAACSK